MESSAETARLPERATEPRAPLAGPLRVAPPRAHPLGQVARDYLALTKPRIISLLLLTTVAAMFVADPAGPALSTILWTMLGGYLAAGGAGAINHYIDRDRDARMARTRSRPLVSGRIEPVHGLVFGIVLGVLAVVQLSLTVNLLAAALSAAGLLGYVFVYTLWLKPLTPQNIVIGGAAGAVPAARRLGRRDRQPHLGRSLALRDRLHVDTAPLLGARAPDQGRLRAHRRADAARGGRRGRDPAPDPDLRDRAHHAHGPAVGDRPLRRDLPGLPRSCSAPASPGSPPGS